MKWMEARILKKLRNLKFWMRLFGMMLKVALFRPPNETNNRGKGGGE